jgi:hypothetical protein
MSFSDFILAILVLIGISFVVWVYDLNPYSKNFQIYSQTCDNMILEDTFCKGAWQDNPVKTFVVSEYSKQVITNSEDHGELITYDNCNVQDRKNWVCSEQTNQPELIVADGKIINAKDKNIQQITRLEWLQNKFLEIVGN